MPIFKAFFNVRETIISEQNYLLLRHHAQDEDFQLYLQMLWETGCRPSDMDFEEGTAKIFQRKTQKYKTVYFTDALLEKLKIQHRNGFFKAAAGRRNFIQH